MRLKRLDAKTIKLSPAPNPVNPRNNIGRCQKTIMIDQDHLFLRQLPLRHRLPEWPDLFKRVYRPLIKKELVLSQVSYAAEGIWVENSDRK
jgi:hypothetical protein